MSKKEEEAKKEEAKKPEFASQGGSQKKNPEDNIPMTQGKVGEEAKTPTVVAATYTGLEEEGIFGKEFKNKFGVSKHYIKYKQIDETLPAPEQVESEITVEGKPMAIMVWKETGEECPFYEGLPANQLAIYKKF